MKSLKLSRLKAQTLNEREMGIINGGDSGTIIVKKCTCSCYYVDHGGPSIKNNRDANYDIGNGGYSGDGNNKHTKTTTVVIINKPSN